MAKGVKTVGRQAGTPNRTTASVKAALEAAFEEMGGIEKLTEWAAENPGEFYKLYAKLLPIPLKADVHTNGDYAERMERAFQRMKQSDRVEQAIREARTAARPVIEHVEPAAAPAGPEPMPTDIAEPMPTATAAIIAADPPAAQQYPPMWPDRPAFAETEYSPLSA